MESGQSRLVADVRREGARRPLKPKRVVRPCQPIARVVLAAQRSSRLGLPNIARAMPWVQKGMSSSMSSNEFADAGSPGFFPLHLKQPALPRESMNALVK